MTAREWFTELAIYPPERVAGAVSRCRREQSFRPSLAELIDAMVLNARERVSKPSGLLAIEARDPNSKGVPPPAEFKRLLSMIKRRWSFPTVDTPPAETDAWGRRAIEARSATSSSNGQPPTTAQRAALRAALERKRQDADAEEVSEP
jgi:hypothetical protein